MVVVTKVQESMCAKFVLELLFFPRSHPPIRDPMAARTPGIQIIAHSQLSLLLTTLNHGKKKAAGQLVGEEPLVDGDLPSTFKRNQMKVAVEHPPLHRTMFLHSSPISQMIEVS